MTAREAAWQRRLLPLMAGMLVVLALFFLVVTLYQMNDLASRVAAAPRLDLKPALASLDNVPDGTKTDERLLRATWRTLAELEGYAIDRRYHQANLLLMMRLWTRYLGFITGMILALVGAAFILGKMREAGTTLDAQGAAGKVAIASSSPGLILAVLGTALMITTIMVDPRIDVQDGPLYLPAWSGRFEADQTMPPPQDLGPGDDGQDPFQNLQQKQKLERKEPEGKPQP